ncbi:hypothetical protein DMC30DRAFT_417275 [Rhodotorula diobovata]|uniref:Uncharacterized protein n=1 Tax=Rhodotorula diobovata TaxID=5288 RepID=A0A5C5FVN9_9BASI|nr:hypothetical protein DMC30DRAFT_417275 [Rhodotorula diobovata]
MQAPSQSPSAAWLGVPSPLSASILAPPPAPAPRQPSRAPSTRPSLAPTHAPHPVASLAAISTATPHSADPVTDARRTLALLLGTGGAGDTSTVTTEGLLDRVQRDVESLLDAYDHAFDPPSLSSSRNPVDPSHALDSLDALVSLLARSSPGGFVPSSTPDGPLSQAHLDRASERAQALFREGVRVRENADVVRAGLSG